MQHALATLVQRPVPVVARMGGASSVDDLTVESFMPVPGIDIEGALVGLPGVLFYEEDTHFDAGRALQPRYMHWLLGHQVQRC